MSKWLIAFALFCAAHLTEHVAQAYQVYVMGWPLHRAGGFLGLLYPWLVHSEWLHYGYAIVMLIGLWALRNQFTGSSRNWWLAAFWIQMWHHLEHLLLLIQATSHHNFFGAPQPISIIQFTGFFYGPADNGFNGLLKMSHFGICTCKGAAPGTIHNFRLALLTVRRLEVHLIYNAIVTVPMVVAIVKKIRSK